MTELRHEHRCSCGAAWPITDADALRRQSGMPMITNAAGAQQLTSTTLTVGLDHAAGAAPMPAVRVFDPVVRT